MLEEASAKGMEGDPRAMEELLTLCARLEAKNEKDFGGRRLPPEMWQKIVDENLDQNDLFALAMTCRFFRETGIRTRLALGATETAERKRRGVATSTSSIGSTSNGMRATTRSLITAMWSLVTATEATTRRSS